jgi:hypothetical protein
VRFMSTTEAKEEVMTTRWMLGAFEAASSMERTPLIAGMMSSFSLSVMS